MPFKNFAISTVATAPSPATSGTSLGVAAGHGGTRFPGASFNATVWPANTIPDPTNAEIVTVTAIATDTFTITRAQEGTTARAIQVGDMIAQTVTAKQENTPEFTYTDLLSSGIPAVPSAGRARLFVKNQANRIIPAFVGPSGLDVTIQESVAFNKVGLWSPPGNATTVPAVLGLPAATAVGTATARNVAATNIATRARRLGYVSAATAAAFAEWRMGAAQWTAGDGAGLGGFFAVFKFVPSNAAAVSGERFFAGMAPAAAATNVEPNTLINCIGVAQLSTDATQFYWVYGGSAAQTAIACGTGVGAPTSLSTALYHLIIFAPPGAANTFYATLRNVGTGVEVSQTFTGAATVVPQSTTFLAPKVWKTNNATSLAVGFDIGDFYISSDN